MTVSARTALLAAMCMTSAALAQTGGIPVDTPPAPLPPETQALVKEQARQDEAPEASPAGPVTIGTIVPEDVEWWSLPQDSVSEVPAITRYKFLLSDRTIAVVDPESRKVIQIIPN